MNVLIVDDNTSVLNALEKKLISNKHQVTCAENGLAALSLVQDTQFDFIITDYKMPFMDGIKLIENLLADINIQPHQILLLSTDTSQALEFKVNQLNVQCLAKPVSAEKVVESMVHSYTFQAA
ncbi:response regulator [Catenovulum sp. 2E275]|uniref:response regulator n=1 Tax=Catenovulum sp. 2E275 TaxID=2980497 RepID=UPI0021D028DE|nr:response regulator [Catenovulum sp. 2E275]MCU4674980.1 response regulator [Catenovulum sp. 2E275]